MKSIVFENKKIFPSKIVCIGRNYIEHIKELNNEFPSSVVIFNKPNSAISNELYFFDKDTRFEGEICFLIENNKIAGVGFGLDLTKANIQKELKLKGLPWERAKAFDNSAVMSKFVGIKEDDIKKLQMKLYINDKLAQHATYDLMIYKPKTLLDEIKSFQSLYNGDIIMSGTPKGVGSYKIGDNFIGQILINNKIILEEKFIVHATNLFRNN